MPVPPELQADIDALGVLLTHGEFVFLQYHACGHKNWFPRDSSTWSTVPLMRDILGYHRSCFECARPYPEVEPAAIPDMDNPSAGSGTSTPIATRHAPPTRRAASRAPGPHRGHLSRPGPPLTDQLVRGHAPLRLSQIAAARRRRPPAPRRRPVRRRCRPGRAHARGAGRVVPRLARRAIWLATEARQQLDRDRACLLTARCQVLR